MHHFGRQITKRKEKKNLVEVKIINFATIFDTFFLVGRHDAIRTFLLSLYMLCQIRVLYVCTKIHIIIVGDVIIRKRITHNFLRRQAAIHLCAYRSM